MNNDGGLYDISNNNTHLKDECHHSPRVYATPPTIMLPHYHYH